jgi:NADH-quinone oxidoreductase subunit M
MVIPNYLISVMIFLPLLVGAILLCLQSAALAKWVSVVTGLILTVFCVILFSSLDPNVQKMQFEEILPFFSFYGFSYHVGIDGLSVVMMLITSISLIVIPMSSLTSHKKLPQFLGLFLLSQGCLMGIFSAMDAILFYIFWEAAMIPMYLQLGAFRAPRVYEASSRFFMYMFGGSLCLLLAFIYLQGWSHQFELESFYGLALSPTIQGALFLALFIAFAVKVPLWPLHNWLPDVNAQAPLGGGLVAAALMIKLGVYGFIRIAVPIIAIPSVFWLNTAITLSLIAIVYVGILAVMEKDMKKLIGYSSIAHMGLAMLGIFMVYVILHNTHDIAAATLSFEGAMMQMVGHAFSTVGLFLGIGILSEKLGTQQLSDCRGLVHRLPLFSVFMMIFCLSNVGLPGTSGFIGEFMILISGVKANFWVMALAATTVVISPAYTLWLYKRVFFGQPNVQSGHLTAINASQLWALGILAVLVVAIGIYPAPILQLLHNSATMLLWHSIS